MKTELMYIWSSIKYVQPRRLLVQGYWKITNQNTKKSPEIESALVNCMGEIRMDNFGYLNITFHFYFYFKTNLQKILWRVHSYSWTSSLPFYQPVHFSLYHPFTPELSYFMDNLYLEFKEQLGRDETSCYETNLLWKANNLELLTNKLGSHRLLEYLLKCLQKDSEGFQ